VPVPTQDSERSYMCGLGVFILSLRDLDSIKFLIIVYYLIGDNTLFPLISLILNQKQEIMKVRIALSDLILQHF
jgi:hypothetical protein